MKTIKISQKFKSNFWKLIRDFIPAFLGVLIALLLSEWREDQKEEEFISRSIVSIYKDNSLNLENIEEQIVLLEKYCDTLITYSKNENMSIIDIIRLNQGFNIIDFTQLSWEILVNSQLVNKIDYNLLIKLTSMNKKITYFDESKNTIADIIYYKAESKNTNDKYRLYIMVKDLLQACKFFKEMSVDLNEFIVNKYGEDLNLDQIQAIRKIK